VMSRDAVGSSCHPAELFALVEFLVVGQRAALQDA
jgi:hypothetical protein